MIKKGKVWKIKRDNIYHALTFAYLLIALCFSVFYFKPVFGRFVQSLVDLKKSVAYYVLYPFYMEDLVTVTVTKIPPEMELLLPMTMDEYHLFFERFFDLLFDKANFNAYLVRLSDIISDFSKFVSPLLIPLLFFGLVIFLIYYIPDKPIKDPNATLTDEEKAKGLTLEEKRAGWIIGADGEKRLNFGDEETESKPLKWYKKYIETIIGQPVKRFCKGYFEFFHAKKPWRWAYRWAFRLVWAYNLNFATIFIEFWAWVFYVAMSIEYSTVFVQFGKLTIDLSVVFQFLPTIGKVVVGYMIFHKIRRSIGDKILLSYIQKDKDFLKNHPGALFIVGKQRSKKTSILTTLKKILERQFREKAMEKFAARDKQFPFFHWRSIEKTVERCRANGTFKTLEDYTIFAAWLFKAWKFREKIGSRLYFRKIIKNKYGYDFGEVLEYSNLYLMSYSNGTIAWSIFEAIERYAQLYNIYTQPTPLDVSNFPIREDFSFHDNGFLPLFDGNPFREYFESMKNSQYSHILNNDAFRVGKVFKPKQRFDEAIEYGIGVKQEVAKDRMNKHTRPKAEKDEATQDNDWFELDTKMRGHVATIDFFDFWRWLFDDQRAGSLGADSKDLCTEVLIKKTHDEKIAVPCYAIEQLFFLTVSSVHDNIKYGIRNRKRKDTLFVHLMDKLFNPLFRHCDRLEARYGYFVAEVKTTDGMDQQVINEKEKIYIPRAFTYNNSFATDSWRTFYRRKHRKAKRTLNDVKQYGGLYPTDKEFKQQNGYDVEMMNYAYGDKTKRVLRNDDDEEEVG